MFFYHFFSIYVGTYRWALSSQAALCEWKTILPYLILVISDFFFKSLTHAIQYKHRPTWTGIPMERSAHTFIQPSCRIKYMIYVPLPSLLYLRCGPSLFIRFESFTSYAYIQFNIWSRLVWPFSAWMEIQIYNS